MSFNVYLNNLFFCLNRNIYNFTDDSRPYVCDRSLNFVLEKSEEQSNTAMALFENNYIEMNSDKCNLLISGNKTE